MIDKLMFRELQEMMCDRICLVILGNEGLWLTVFLGSVLRCYFWHFADLKK